MNKTQKTISLAIGGAFALSIAATSVHAAENPFALKALSSGYQVADHHDAKTKDGKCGTGKCGGSMKKTDAMEKGAEGKCGGDKMTEGKCSAEKMTEGKCSAEKAAEGKCGGDKK